MLRISQAPPPLGAVTHPDGTAAAAGRARPEPAQAGGLLENRIPSPTRAAGPGGERYWYMDSLRATLMIGGVFSHTAFVYSTEGHWLVRDPGPYRAIDFFAAALMSMRMPAFFIIAGFFCAMLYRRANGRGVLRRRLVALGLPVLTMGVTLQPLEHLLCLIQKGSPAGLTAVGFLASYVATGAFISHLWFLLNLIIYYVFASALLANREVGARAARLVRSPLLKGLLRSKIALSVLCAAMMVAVLHVFGDAGASKGFEVADVARFAPFFVLGSVAFLDSDLFDSFLSFNGWDGAALAAVIVVRGALGGHLFSLHGRSLEAFSEFAFYVLGFMLSMVVLRVCRRHFNGRHPLQQAMVDASFSIYLFHHVCVVALAVALIAWAPGLNTLIKFTVVVAVATAVPVAVHMMVLRRWTWLRFLFNGRTTPVSA